MQNEPLPIRQRDASIPQKLAEVIDLALVEKPEIYLAARGRQRAEDRRHLC
ncbi:hypothetical protein [Fischerella sp. JS2]|uniref:hypothetical protein n=1 Tax=Fischerella sp. JS2 TaxID=2597771 RepID=UPI0028E4FAF3|nr:hypothetical protein [Fischerella sp. JS2]